MRTSCCTILAAFLAFSASACHQADDPIRRRPDESLVSYTISAADVLQRCAQAHERARTLQARGVLRAYHQAAPRVVPIRWTFERPGRCRLQIGPDAVIVLGRDWWSFRAADGRFTRHRQFTRTPIQTAALLLTDGLPLIIDELTVEGRGCLRSAGLLGRPGWRLEGTAWGGGRPCYVLEREEGGGDRPQALTLWIDQDSFLLRAWKLTAWRAGARPRLIAGCDFDELAADAPLASGAFSLEPPLPLELLAPAEPPAAGPSS